MACFVVPVAEALVVTVAARVVKHSEKKMEQELKTVPGTENMHVAAVSVTEDEDASLQSGSAHNGHSRKGIPFSRKLDWLSWLLWGGSLLLLFEHIWHGEVVPWFPFFTAASNAADTAAMLHEMATVGVAMAALVTAVWGVMLLVTYLMGRKKTAPQSSAQN